MALVKVWNVLGELAKVSNAERKEIEKKISSLVSAESREMSKKIKDINDIFSEAGVSIKPDTSKDFASTLIKLYLSGQAINQNGKQLNYYSTGTNTVKYLELLLRAIDAISKAKMKEPIILLEYLFFILCNLENSKRMVLSIPRSIFDCCREF